ncbi:MAG: hypothetical protein AAGH15_14535, partial [Myxococcota bacterium]
MGRLSRRGAGAFLAGITLLLALPGQAQDREERLWCAVEPPAHESMPGLGATSVGPPAAPMCHPDDPLLHLATPLPSEASAREAWRAVRAGGWLELSVVEAAAPELADVFALLRAERQLAEGDADGARERVRVARASPDATVTMNARAGEALALLALDHRRALTTARGFLDQYPEHRRRRAIELAMAGYQERKGRRGDALQRYRQLVVYAPATPEAAEARRRIEAIAAGHRVRGLLPIERVQRADELLSWGPLPEARESLAALREERLPAPLTAQARLLDARLFRFEGRFPEAAAAYAAAKQTGVEVGEPAERELREKRSTDVARAAVAREREAARRRLRQVRRGRRLDRVAGAHLLQLIEIAAGADLREELDAILAAAAEKSLPPRVRLDAALRAFGAGDDARILALLEGVELRPGSLGREGRYFQGVALARLERHAQAADAFGDVLTASTGDWYAMLARQRLAESCRQQELPPA